MGLNLSTLTPASLKSKNVATEEYVDSGINNLTKVEDIAWQSEVQAAIDNNATTIDGGKIVTNEAFVNNLNATGGIAADYVNANEINGITINGGIINGARINGAVIKASYLDLDGELEVLTNYHISVATYNANPSLYSDAVYISADNEYRIPSWSNIKETTSTRTITSAGALYGKISAYNIANTGDNNKAVKIQPTFQNTSSTLAYCQTGSGSCSIQLRLGTTILATISISSSSSHNYAANTVTISSPYVATKSFAISFNDSNYSIPPGAKGSWTASKSTSGTILGIPIFGDLNCTMTATGTKSIDYGAEYQNESIYSSAVITLSILSSSYQLGLNWNTTGKININIASVTSGAFSGYVGMSGIGINNMI